MDLLKRLTIKSLMLNKKRTIVTIIGIILSVALLTAVASMYFSAIETLIEFEINKKGDYHVGFLDVDVNELADFKNYKDIEKVYITQNEGYSELKESKNENKPYVFVKKFTKESLENLGLTLVEGRLPKNENEIIIPTHLKTNGRVELQIGEEIELNVGERIDKYGKVLNQENPYYTSDTIEYDEFGNKVIIEEASDEKIIDTIKRKYKIVGICERPSAEMESYSAPGYTFITMLDDKNITGNVDVFAKYKRKSLKNEKKITSKILGIDELVYKCVVYGYDDNEIKSEDEYDKILEEFNKSKYEIKTNKYLINLQSDPMSEDGGLVTIAAIVCGIIIVTSVFCIKNSFDISITEKIKQYGMLRSMGATKKQVKKTVYFEAFSLGIVGIPLGILSGFLASYILIIISNKLLAFSFTEGLKLVFIFSWQATIISIILGALTIWLSSVRSARKASKITPILAIKNSGNIKIKAKKLKTPKLISKLFGVGGEISYKNLKRNKKKYRTISISIIVVVSVFIAIYYFSSLAFDSIKSEFNMQDYNISIYLKNFDDKETLNKILNLDNIEEVSVQRSECVEFKNAKFSKKYYDNIKKQYLDNNIPRNCYIISIGEDCYKKYIKELGLNYNYVKDKAIIYNVSEIVVYDDNNNHQIQKVKEFDFKSGDKISFYLADKEENEISLEIAKMTEKCPFSLYDGHPYIIVSDDYFNSLKVKNNVLTICINSSNANKLQDDVEALLKDREFSLNNVAENVQTIKNMFILIAIFVYGFIIVISLIGVTNVFNTITTSMELRRSEFASLRSIGMTDKEFSRMIRLESLFLGCKSLFIGIPIGIGLSYLINYHFVKNLGEKINYKLPIIAVLIAIIVVFLLITVIMKYSLGKIKKQNIIETIRNENI